MHKSTPALELARSLGGCASRSGSGKYCYLARLCPACNTRMKRIRWDNRYSKFTAAMLHVGATPIAVRIRSEAGMSLRDGLGNVRGHLAQLLKPMSSSYSRRRTHPLTHAILGGTHGELVRQSTGRFDIQAVILLWVRPGNADDVATVLELLRVHARSCRIPESSLELRIISGTAELNIVDAVRTVLELTSGTWEITDPADAVRAHGLLAGVRRAEWFGMPATRLDQPMARMALGPDPFKVLDEITRTEAGATRPAVVTPSAPESGWESWAMWMDIRSDTATQLSSTPASVTKTHITPRKPPTPKAPEMTSTNPGHAIASPKPGPKAPVPTAKHTALHAQVADDIVEDYEDDLGHGSPRVYTSESSLNRLWSLLEL